MIDAAVKALAQLFTPPLRAVLLKAIGLALLMIIIIGIVLNRVFSALAASGANWAEQTSGFAPHAVWQALAWVMSIMASSGHRHRRAVPDAGGYRLCRQLFRR